MSGGGYLEREREREREGRGYWEKKSDFCLEISDYLTR